MKAIYSDRVGILPWGFAFFAIVSAMRACDGGKFWPVVLSSVAALAFAALSIREFRRRSVARRAGLDHTIVEVVDR